MIGFSEIFLLSFVRSFVRSLLERCQVRSFDSNQLDILIDFFDETACDGGC